MLFPFQTISKKFLLKVFYRRNGKQRACTPRMCTCAVCITCITCIKITLPDEQSTCYWRCHRKHTVALNLNSHSTDTGHHSSGKQNKVLEMRSLSPDSQIGLPFISLQTDIQKSANKGLIVSINMRCQLVSVVHLWHGFFLTRRQMICIYIAVQKHFKFLIKF